VTFTERHAIVRPGQGGFTMVELIVVMVMLGILAVYALPKMTAAVGMRDDAWHEQLQSALRYAQKGAVARRRLTCVSISATSVTITTALTNPATSCNTAIPSPDGNVAFATSDNASSGTTVSPAGVIYFQPDGRATTDGAGTVDVPGTTTPNRTITMSGGSNITVNWETGYVQ
jgi:MSHA pilin protein MshC